MNCLALLLWVVRLALLGDPGTKRRMRILRQQPDKSVATARAQCFHAVLAAFLAGLFVASTLGCDVQRRKSDAELGLTPQQAAGRRIYDDRCERCHEPYSTKDKKGPGLQGMFKHQYLSVSGLPANDERVLDIISHGRKDMPGYSQVLSQQQMTDLLAYLHTL
jgi:mono/diheme cytochrome c family protein